MDKFNIWLIFKEYKNVLDIFLGFPLVGLEGREIKFPSPQAIPLFAIRDRQERKETQKYDAKIPGLRSLQNDI